MMSDVCDKSQSISIEVNELAESNRSKNGPKKCSRNMNNNGDLLMINQPTRSTSALVNALNEDSSIFCNRRIFPSSNSGNADTGIPLIWSVAKNENNVFESFLL